MNSRPGTERVALLYHISLFFSPWACATSVGAGTDPRVYTGIMVWAQGDGGAELVHTLPCQFNASISARCPYCQKVIVA